uniref:Uncharacterized protein n=1 Tax=Oryza brachyantha TaxID=4533 RepID=J3LD01_ORYBR
MANPSAIFVPLQFDSHNYREWAFCVQTVLGGYGLVSHLTGTAPIALADNSNASAVTSCINDDGRCWQWILHLLQLGCSKKTNFIEQFMMYQFVMGLSKYPEKLADYRARRATHGCVHDGASVQTADGSSKQDCD